jgi:hypothetical protein
VANRRKDLLRQPHTQQQRPLLITRRTTAALPARKRNKKLFTTIRTTHPRKSFPQVPAFEKLVNRGTNERPLIAIFRLEPLVVNMLELVEMVTHQLEKG